MLSILCEKAPPVLIFQRTEWNVRDGDGTLVFSLAPKLTGGSLKPIEFARKHNRPLIHVSAVDPDPAGRLQRFLEDNDLWPMFGLRLSPALPWPLYTLVFEAASPKTCDERRWSILDPSHALTVHSYTKAAGYQCSLHL